MKKYENELLLGLLLAFYFYLGATHFWIYPAPSDQLEYVQSIHWGTSVGGYWPWLDRMGFGAILGLMGWIPLPVYKVAPFYGLLISGGSLAIGSFWIRARYGFGAALYFLALMISSHYVYHFATEIYPEPTLIFFLLIAVIFLFNPSGKNRRTNLFFSGLALCIAALCKIVVLPITALIALYVFRRDRFMGNWRYFAMGLGAGFVVIFSLFVTTYGLASWVDMFVQFYLWNFKFMLVGNPGVNNIVSYYHLFVDKGYLPVFIALFVSLGIYRNKDSKAFAAIAWILGGTICFIYLVGERPGSVISNYMYPMFFFAAISLSIYWGRLLQIETTPQKIRATALVFVMLVAAWSMGANHSTDSYFDVGHYPQAKFLVKSLLAIGVFVLAGLPTLLELSPGKPMAMFGLAAISFFSLLYNGGRAKTHFDKILLPEVEFHYSNAPLLELIPSKDFFIYNSHWFGQTRARRVVTVYTHFFGQKFEIPPGPDSQKLAMDIIPKKIRVIQKPEELKEVTSPTLVTDRVEEVQKVFPDAKIVGAIPWKDYELQILSIPSNEKEL